MRHCGSAICPGSDVGVVGQVLHPLLHATWADIAARSGVPLLNIEVICSDRLEHRRRVEQRQSDITGLTTPTWSSVANHEFEAWTQPILRLDTTSLSVDQAVEIIVGASLLAIGASLPK